MSQGPCMTGEARRPDDDPDASPHPLLPGAFTRRSRSVALAASALAMLAWLPAAALADVLQLKDGRWVDGVKMRLEEKAVVVQYANGDVRVPIDLVEDVVIEGVAPWEPRTDEERAKRAEGLVPLRGKWVKPEVREKAIRAETAKRKAELDEIRAHQEWRNRWKFETKNFTFESTLPPGVNEEYAALLETYFEEFRKVWGIKVPKDWGKLKVCFYRDRKSFNQVSGGRGGVQAYYRFVPPRELNFFYDHSDPRTTLDTMFHEANHYLTDLLDERAVHPHWIGEGMAEYYGSAEWDPKTKTMKVGRIQEGRLAELRADIDAGKRMQLDQLIGSGESAYEHYYWGWSFMHFMLSTPAYEKKFKQYFVDLARAKDVQRTTAGYGFLEVSGDECLRAFNKRFGEDKLRTIEKEWWDYIDRLEPTGVRGMERAGIAAYQQGRWKFRAPRQLKAAIDAGSVNPRVYICYARCLRMKAKGPNEEGLAVIEKAIEVCDPLNADLRAEKGYWLTLLDKKDEGKKWIELAREMNPEEPYLDLEIAEALGAGDDE